MLIGLMTSKSGGMIEKIVTTMPNHDYIIFTNNVNAKLNERCKKNGLLLNVINDKVFYTHKDSIGVDLIILCGFMKILPKDFVNINKVINYHPGLADLKGKNPVERALQEFKSGLRTKTGGMIHHVDEGVDTGKIIGTFIEPIYEYDDYKSLTERMENNAIQLLKQILK
ncbi:MAG: hypothetical protein KKC77_19370 [Proteobacteria bacterium]|nr:hypothetical protein [Pseudomonadota bacterium]